MRKGVVWLGLFWCLFPPAAWATDVAKSVSLVHLLAAPARFEGQRVEVRGFCRFAFEEHALYLSREDSEIVNTASAVWLNTGTAQYKGVNDAFVFVSGVFTAKEGGHLGGWGGVLRDITVLERTPTRAEMEKSRQPDTRR